MTTEPRKPIATSADGAGLEQASTTDTPPADPETGPDGTGSTDAEKEADRLGDFA